MPTHNELLADHFLKAAGVATVSVDAAGAIGSVNSAGIACPPGCVMLFCAHGSNAKVATLAAARTIPAKAGQAAVLAVLRSTAADCGVGLTPHQTVIQRALGRPWKRSTKGLRICRRSAA
jgi:hypothetical protein